ncbi:MAG TPA: hypothetical protein VM686_22735, partial [Polyangiaceae bacterium]|nr:hypothetical protein [Polyangiaceae bacterium]
YGGGVTGFWQLLDSGFGTLPIFPAERWFAARYGLPGTAFGNASHARWYIRDFRTLRWTSRDIDLALLTRQHLTEGLALQGENEVVMTGSEARAVFSTQWPHVTHVRLSVRSAVPQRLAIGLGSATGVEWIEAQKVDGATKLSFSVDQLKLGSGLHELYLRLDPPAAGCAIRSLAFDDVEARTALTSPGPRSVE